MPTLCKDCEHRDCHLCTAPTAEKISYVTGDLCHPLCEDTNFGSCQMFKSPEPPAPIYRDTLGREFGVLDALLLVNTEYAASGTILLLCEISRNAQDGHLEVRGHTTTCTCTPITLFGKAGKPFKGVYRLGTTDEVVKATRR